MVGLSLLSTESSRTPAGKESLSPAVHNRMNFTIVNGVTFGEETVLPRDWRFLRAIQQSFSLPQD